jgi:endoribonuclease Dicer
MVICLYFSYKHIFCFKYCNFFFLNVLNIVFITDMISFVFSGDRNLLDSGSDYSKAVVLGYVSPKLLELLQIFQSFG